MVVLKNTVGMIEKAEANTNRDTRPVNEDRASMYELVFDV
jgi:hypothetical protein